MISCNSSLLQIPEWTIRARNHSAAVGPYADAFLCRRNSGHIHPVHDFLFTYYNCSPLKLKQWIPSVEERLVVTPEIRNEYPWLNDHWFQQDDDILALNSGRISGNSFAISKFIAELCGNILKRTPRFGCYGLHEWAMVYKLSPDAIRHNGYSLRLTHKQLEEFVESQTICCSHYDAYRFFTPEARPLNTLNPVLGTRLQMEQGGCVHANMDLYKWSVKLWPWIGSDFIAKTFFHAFEGRELDMRASPYDLRKEGYEPICIETEEGRRQYQKEQQRLTDLATPLREELRAFCERFTSLSILKPPIV